MSGKRADTPSSARIPTSAVDQIRRLLDAGRAAEAHALAAQWRGLAPGCPTARAVYGEVSLVCGDSSTAHREIRAALSAGLTGGAASIALARRVEARGAPALALEVLADAARASPDDPAVVAALGFALRRSGRQKKAREHLRRAFALDPALLEQAAADAERLVVDGRLQDAARSFEELCKLAPAAASIHAGLAAVELALGQPERARATADTAVRLDSRCVPAWINRGNAQRELGDYAGARCAFEEALNIDPGSAVAALNLGIECSRAGDGEAAIELLRRGVALAPANAEALFCLAAELLRRGIYDEGWRAFESRLQLGGSRGGFRRPRGATPWSGEPDHAGDLVLVCDQGVGDTIQFARFARQLRRPTRRLVLQCDRRLIRLMRTCAFFDDVVDYDAELPSDCRWLPLLSVPAAFNVDATLHRCPHESGIYLSAESALAADWRNELRRGALAVGIAWQGNPVAERGSQLQGRSIPLRCFEPIAAVPGVQLYPLQIGFGSEQIATVPFRERLGRFAAPIDVGPDAFVDTAAIISSLDLVITSDTAIAHLAGALGRPVWVALPKWPEWRWSVEGSESPWYASMRLFRQANHGDWPGVFARMAAELTELVARPAR